MFDYSYGVDHQVLPEARAGMVKQFIRGGALEILWIVLIAFLWPQVSPLNIAIGVCLLTCGVEFLQLWHPPFLQALRANLLGRLILGTSFSWSDFPYYIGYNSLTEWIAVNSKDILPYIFPKPFPNRACPGNHT